MKWPDRIHWDEMARIAYSEWYNNCRTEASTRVTKNDETKLRTVIACALETAYEMGKIERPQEKVSWLVKFFGKK